MNQQGRVLSEQHTALLSSHQHLLTITQQIRTTTAHDRVSVVIRQQQYMYFLPLTCYPDRVRRLGAYLHPPHARLWILDKDGVCVLDVEQVLVAGSVRAFVDFDTGSVDDGHRRLPTTHLNRELFQLTVDRKDDLEDASDVAIER